MMYLEWCNFHQTEDYCDWNKRHRHDDNTDGLFKEAS